MSIYYKIMSQSDRKQFSVLLNYNKEQSNSDASDFVAMYSKDIVIPPMSKVALYSASLIRKPVVLTENQSFRIVFSDAYTFPQGEFTLPSGVVAVNIQVDKGSYSKREFLDHLETRTQGAFNTFISAYPTKFLEYKPAVNIQKSNIFYSITPYVNPEQYFPISETTQGSNNIDLSFNVGIAPEHGVDASTWNNFAFARASLFPFTRNHREDYDTNQNNTDWFFKVDLRGTEECLTGFLPQSYQKNIWTAPNVVQTSDLLNSVQGTIPNCFFGLYFQKSQNNSDAVTMSIVVSKDLESRVDSNANISEMISLVDFQLNNIAQSGIFVFKIYFFFQVVFQKF